MFIDSLLLDRVAYGFSGGPEWVTLVVPQRSGQESRNSERSRPKHYYAAPYQNIDEDHRHLVVSAFNACMGRANTFRFFDRMDYSLDDAIIGTADGTADQEIQLVKPYSFGANSISRPITKPVDSAVNYGRGTNVLGAAPAYVITADNTPVSFALDYTTGIVTLTASEGAVIRATGWFDVQVRFDQDKLMMTRGNKNAHTTDVELVEVWDDDDD
jgi:uncharacterized protein (TIGR02217 family)